MAGIFAKIDVDFPDDPKVIDAGPLAELVYLRCILRSRATLSDGVIDARRLVRWGAGIDGDLREHAQRLVEVGLWEVHPDGWAVPERVWREWNPTAAEIATTRENKRLQGEKGNHTRWHTSPDKMDDSCSFCLASLSDPSSDPSSESPRIASPKRVRSPETETETETENSPFRQFWIAYPRKTAKPAALKAWNREKPPLDEVLAALKAQTPTWTDPKFIPHPATWINQRRWEDETAAPGRDTYRQPVEW